MWFMTIFCVIFRTVYYIFIVVICNTTFWPLYSPNFLRCVPCLFSYGNDLTWEINFKAFPRLNHFHTQINKGHLKKAGGYSGRRIQRQERCVRNNNNKNEDNSPKNNIKNIAFQASSQKFKLKFMTVGYLVHFSHILLFKFAGPYHWPFCCQSAPWLRFSVLFLSLLKIF